MRELNSAEWAAVSTWFTPERPGPLLYPHLRHTGLGRCLVDGTVDGTGNGDRSGADPRAVLVELPGNYALRGDPQSVDPAELVDVVGLVEAPPEWVPTLRAAVGADGEFGVWPRIVAMLPATADLPSPRHPTRRLGPADVEQLRDYDPDGTWIWDTYGGPDQLAATGAGHGAFVDGRLVSIAVPFFVGDEYVDIGVVTAADHRGRGLSAACAAAVAADIRADDRIPSWTTSPENEGSLAVAARLGFVRQRDDVLYAVRMPIPT